MSINIYISDDDDDDEIADYDTDALEHFEEERCLDIIEDFKTDINKEIEFYSIYNISSIEILNLTKIDHKFTKNNLTCLQLEIFDIMFSRIYGYSTTESNYNFIASKIFKRIYIN